MVVNKEVYVIFGKEQRRTFQKRGKIFFEKRKVLLSGFVNILDLTCPNQI